MTLPQEVQDAIDSADMDCGLELTYLTRDEWATIRAELHRLNEIAEGVDPLVIRLGEVTTKLEALISMRNEWERDARERLVTFGQHLPASVECLVERFDAAIQSHLQGAGDEG
jgi:hypothetical protein